MSDFGARQDERINALEAKTAEAIADLERRVAELEGGGQPPIEPPPGGGDAIVPGDGWQGDTPTPPATGDYTATAKWNVVPHQRVDNGFRVGVIAHHIDGIDRVEIAANGGKWLAIKEPSVSDESGCDEYHAPLDGLTGPIELRAIAYPVAGIPRVLEPLVLYPDRVGSVIELDAGSYSLREFIRDLPSEGWLTIKAKDGLTRDQVSLRAGGQWRSSGHLQLQGCTIDLPGGQGTLVGRSKNDPNAWLWVDDCEIVGAGNVDNATAWVSHLWGRSFFTNCGISEVKHVFYGSTGELLARNIVIRDTYEDVFKAFGLAVNIDIKNVYRGANSSKHPDLFEVSVDYTNRNVIFQDIAASEAKAQGLAGGNVDGFAFVRVDIETQDLAAMQFGRNMRNMLIKDSRFDSQSGVRLRNIESVDGVVFENSLFNGSDRPTGWDDRIEIR